MYGNKWINYDDSDEWQDTQDYNEWQDTQDYRPMDSQPPDNYGQPEPQDHHQPQAQHTLGCPHCGGYHPASQCTSWQKNDYWGTRDETS